MPEDAKSKSTLEKWVAIGGILVSVVAILVTIFFSIRSERTKELTVTYLAKRPLVSIESTRASVGLEVRLGGNPITTPWLVSGRLENTGTQPVEERDIEVPAKISFTRAKIVGAEIVQRSQPTIFANVSAKGTEVALDHKLLNPGDWIGFDIVFDGEPDIPPTLAFRISGITQPIQRVVTPGERRAHPTVVPIPMPLLYLLLTIGSLTAILVAIGGLALMGSSVIDLFSGTRESQVSRRVPSLNPGMLAERLNPSSPSARTVFALLGGLTSLELLDQPAALQAAIQLNVAPAVLEAIDLDLQSAAMTLSTELKESLRHELGQQLFLMLPSGSDRAARTDFEKVNVREMSAADLLERAKKVAMEVGVSPQSAAKFDTSELAGGLILMLIGASLIFLLGGTWRTVSAL